MYKGKVKWFNAQKGYGFITNLEGKEIFAHYSRIVADGFKTLEEGQEVKFDVIDTEKGEQAVNIEAVNENIGVREDMLDKKQTIEKILKEYSKYGIVNVKEMAEELYDSAIQAGVPHEVIYSGMKMIFNQAVGIDNKETVEEIGEGFKEYAVNDTRKANPTATDKNIAKNFKEELEDSFNWKSLMASDEIITATKNATERFIKENV